MTAAVNVASLGTAMSADSSGNVGIGTSSPAAKLVSAGSSATNFKALILRNGDGTVNSAASIDFEASTGTQGDEGSMAGRIAGIRTGSGTSGALAFSTTNAGVLGERARIYSTGNVSVGTLFDLSYKMALVSTSTSSPALYLRSTASGDVGTAQLRLIKADNTNTTSQIFIQFVIDGNNVNSGQINANGASQAAFGSFSDVRLKENIVDLPLQLSNIMALRPVEFDYKDGCGHQIGFIAQEMQQVYPDAIGVGENDMLTITGWSKTEARLVKAIQEQQALITQLQADVAELKARP
jgi:trimeric autotransporter adhesin